MPTILPNAALHRCSKIINLQGEMVIPAQFSDALSFGDDGWAVVKQKRKWGYINTEGEVVIPLQYSEAWGFDDHGLAIVERQTPKGEYLYGFINKAVEEVIPIQYSDVSDFANNGLARVQHANNKYGYINRDGVEVIPAQFYDAEGFNEQGYALVKLDGHQGDINAQGQTVVRQATVDGTSVIKNIDGEIIWSR